MGSWILDDDSGMGRLLPRLVRTSLWTGMLDEHVQPAIDMIMKAMNFSDFPPDHFRGWAPNEITHLLCLRAVNDPEDIEAHCREVVAAHPAEAEKYRKGKKGLLGFLVARVMDMTRNGANAKLVDETLRRLLEHTV